MLDLGNSLLYFIFEFCIFLTSVRIVYLVTATVSRKFTRAELLILWIIGTIILSSSIAAVFSFVQFNGTLQLPYTFLLDILDLQLATDQQDYPKYSLLVHCKTIFFQD